MAYLSNVYSNIWYLQILVPELDEPGEFLIS